MKRKDVKNKSGTDVLFFLTQKKNCSKMYWGGISMKTVTTIGRILIYLVGLFFVLMAFDCFGDSESAELDTFWKQLACFFISISPGVVMILLNYFLRKKELIMGILLILASIVFFFVFKFYREFSEKLLTIGIVCVLPLAIRITFVVSRNRFSN